MFKIFRFKLRCPNSGFEKEFSVRGSIYVMSYMLGITVPKKANQIHKEGCPLKGCSTVFGGVTVFR